MNQHPTVEQNQAHRADIIWAKSTGRKFSAAGESFTSEYLNVFTGQAIRKSWKMTGQDWFIFDAEGTVTGRAHSLTWAKFDAADAPERCDGCGATTAGCPCEASIVG